MAPKPIAIRDWSRPLTSSQQSPFGRAARRSRGTRAATGADKEHAAEKVRLTGVPWRRLFGYLRPHLLLFSVAIIALIIGSAAGLLLPLVIGGLVGEVVSAGDSGGLDQLSLMLLGLAIVMAISAFAQTWSLGVIGERIVARLRAQLFERLVSLELDFYVRRRVGELISRLSSDVTQVRTMLTQTITSLLSSLIGLIGSVVILFLLSPTLLFVVLALAPALVIVAIVFSRPLRRLSTKVQDAIAESTTTAEEALSGIRVVKSFGREEWELERYGKDLEGVVGTAIRLVTWRGMFAALMTFLGFGVLIIILWYTGRQVIDGALSLAALTSFLLYGVAIGTSLSSLAGIYGQFQEGAGAVQRVFELIDEQSSISQDPAATPLKAASGSISFENVTFGYADERAVLRDISMEIAAGEVLAVVGPSGAGKTTLCNLIPRLWDVSAGRVMVDGIDVRELELGSLRNAISLVPQDATVFGGTVDENIRYGRLDATDEDVIKRRQGCQRARLHRSHGERL